MPTPTTTYALSKPTIGADENAWGAEINATFDKLDDLLDGTLSIAPNLVGWKVGGVAVTVTAAELNVLDGIPGTLTATELGYVDGVTSAIQTQLDARQPLDADLTAIAGLSTAGVVARTGAGTAAARTITGGGLAAVTDGNGVSGNPTVTVPVASQAQAEAGTDNATGMTPLRTAQAIAALVPAPTAIGVDQSWAAINATASTSYVSNQNTTGQAIQISIRINTSSSGGQDPVYTSGRVDISADGSDWVRVAETVTNTATSTENTVNVIVPDDHYYRYRNGTLFAVLS